MSSEKCHFHDVHLPCEPRKIIWFNSSGNELHICVECKTFIINILDFEILDNYGLVYEAVK